MTRRQLCVGCLVNLTKRQSSRFCSRQCWYKFNTIRPNLKCAVCDATFHQRVDRQKYCSEACAYVGKRPTWRWASYVPIERRFQYKVYQRGDCWEWRGGHMPSGYGFFTVRGSRKVMAHRYAYEMTKGKIPSHLEIDHICAHPWCVRPSHLEAVPQRVNARRAWARGNNRRRDTITGRWLP